MILKKHIVIFSHGFGVRKDDVGLLSGIAEALPECECILFDYYDLDYPNKILTTKPFSQTVLMLQNVINEARKNNPDAIIDIIGHSQGDIIVALANPDGIRKTILLSPSFDMGIERTLNRYRERKGATIDLDGMSTLPEFDGFVRKIPKEYWVERKLLKPIEDYNNFADHTEMIMIEANQDEILRKTELKNLNPKIKTISLDGDHNFNGSARAPLVEAIRKYLV